MERTLRLANRLRDVVLLRYLIASGVSLCVDMGSFMVLLALGSGAVPAAAAGYALGIVTHWLISSRKVFDGVAERGARRTRQKAMFLVSALIGMAVTTSIVSLGSLAEIDPRIGKLVAVAASFSITWLLRSRLIFRAPATVQA